MILKLRFLYLTLSLLCTINVFSQNYNIIGKVVDQSNAPIEFANVVLYKDEAKTFIKGTTTDSEGTFILNSLDEATYYISISFIGLETLEQKLILTGDVDLKTVILNENSESLSEVTIVGKKPTIIRKPDRLIFNVENTALTEGSTLGVLKSTPGVIVSESGIDIKSAPATVFINNRRVQLTSQELIQLLESAPANSIKSIEVITNPPASYDADSGSVINIVMQKNLVTGYRGSAAVNYTQGVFPRYNTATSHYFKNDKINVNLNYSYTGQKINRNEDGQVNFLNNDDSINQIWRSQNNRNTRSETHNLNLNFDYYINERNTLSLTSTGLYTPYFKYRINNQTDQFNANGDFLTAFKANNLSRDNKYNIGTDLIFRHDFKDASSLSFSAHHTIYDYERDQNVFQDELDDTDSEFNTLANQDTQIVSGKIDYNLPINETSALDLGLKYANVTTESTIERTDIINEIEVPNLENTDAFNYNESVFAGFANYSKSWDKIELNLGLRVEQTNIEGESLSTNVTNTQDYINLFPNAGLSYNINDNTTVYGSYKRSITRPSYTNLNPFTFFINENTVVLGNPNLIPTYRDHYKIGVSFLEYFTFEAYYMNYDGDIVELPRQDNTTNRVEFTPVNLDKKIDFGFDLAFDYAPSDRWYLYAVTSFYKNIEESNFGDEFVEQSKWANYSILQNSWALLEDRSLNINFTLTWIGENLQQFQTVEDQLFSELSISKSIFNKRGVVSLVLQDLFNFQDQTTTINYLNQSSRNFVDIDNRFIKIGFRYKFGNTKLTTNERTTDAEERERIKDLE